MMIDFQPYLVVAEWLGLLSVITFVISLVAIPLLIARLPVNYFISHRREVEKRHRQHPVAAKIIFVARNFAGAAFLCAGIAMLVLPGQGIITILIGISLMDFPGKQHVVDFLVRRPRVVRLLNWIRKKQKKPPFAF